MRSKNAAINLAAFMLYESIVFIGNIIFPRLIILEYGSSINGLTATITRVLSLINLIQAGAVGTAIFQMYRPVAENDYKTQSEILYSSKAFYKKIVIIYTIGSILVGAFYSIYLKDDGLSASQIFLAFLIFSINGAIQLFAFSIGDIFFSPHQKKYYVTFSQIIYQLVNYSLQAIVIVNRLPFVFIYISILIGTIVGTGVFFVIYRKHTKNVIDRNPPNKRFYIPDRKYLMLSCVGSEMITMAPTVIVTTVIGLLYSSVFSVYSLVFVSSKTVLSTIQISISPIFGNLVKTSTKEKIYNVFNIVEYITIVIGSIIIGCATVLILPFINLYTSSAKDVDYYSPVLALFSIAYICLFTILTSFSYVSTVYGLFRQTCKITLTASIIGVLVSILFTRCFGMPYVMIGLLLYLGFTIIATNYILKKNVDWYSEKVLIKRSAFVIVNFALFMCVGKLIDLNIDSWKSWAIRAFEIAFVEVIIIAIYSLLFERDCLKTLYGYSKNLKSVYKK